MSTSTLNIRVDCSSCGIYMFMSDKKENVTCSYCKEGELESKREGGDEIILEKKREQEEGWNIQREHPDSKRYQ